MTNYFLDTVNGNDSSNGTTAALAKKTAAAALALLSNDDTLKVAHGSEFSSPWTMPGTGITIEGYVVDITVAGCSAFTVSRQAPKIDLVYDAFGLTWSQVAGQDCMKATLPAGIQAAGGTSTLCVRFKDTAGQGPFGGRRNTNLRGEAADGLTYEWDISADSTTIYIGGSGLNAGGYDETNYYTAVELIAYDYALDLDGNTGGHLHGFVLKNYGYSTSAGGVIGTGAGGTETFACSHCVFDPGVRANLSSISGNIKGIALINFLTLTVTNCTFIGLQGAAIQNTVNGANTITIYNTAFLGVGIPVLLLKVGGSPTVSYGNCLFYGIRSYASGYVQVTDSGAGNTDVTETDLGGNIEGLEPGMAAIANYPTCPSNFTIDDAGSFSETEDFVDDVIFQLRGHGLGRCLPTVAAVANGYNMDAGCIAKLNEWLAAGCEIANHSYCHSCIIPAGHGATGYVNAGWRMGLKISYSAGTTAVVTIATNTLTTTIDSTPDLVLDLTSSSYDELGKLVDYIDAQTNYSCSLVLADVNQTSSWKRKMKSTCLADCTDKNIKAGPNALTIQYTGAGSAAVMNISNNNLTTTCTGASGDDLDIDLTDASYDDLTELAAAINGESNYTCSVHADADDHESSSWLAGATDEDIKTGAYTHPLDAYYMFLDATAVWAMEMGDAKTWLDTNVPGAASSIYVWPFGIPDFVNATGRAAEFAASETNGMTFGRLAYITGTLGNYRYERSFEGGHSIHEVMTQFADQRTQATIEEQVRELMGYARVMGMPITFYCHATDPTMTAAVPRMYIREIKKNGSYQTLAGVLAELTGSAVEVRTTGSEYCRTDRQEFDVEPVPGSRLLQAGSYVTGIHDTFTWDAEGNNVSPTRDTKFGFYRASTTTRAAQHLWPALEIQSTDGSACTVTVTAGTSLTTSKTGGTGGNLSLAFATYNTVRKLVEAIRGTSGYTARYIYPRGQARLDPGAMSTLWLQAESSKDCLAAPYPIKIMDYSDFLPDIGAVGYCRPDALVGGGYRGMR